MKNYNALACVAALSCLAWTPARSQDKPPAAAASKAELPSGESILDKYVEAIGGAEAFQKVKNAVFKGSMTGMGIDISVTIYKAPPNLFAAEMEMPMGKVSQGFDGKTGWVITPNGPQVLPENETNEMKNQYIFTHDWRAAFSKAVTVGAETVDGEDCYKVAMTPKAGSPLTNLYSKKSGLLVRSDMTAPDGSRVQFLSKDYRKVDGVMFPFQLVTAVAGQGVSLTTAFTEVKVNADVPADKFEPPAEIKALLEKK